MAQKNNECTLVTNLNIVLYMLIQIDFGPKKKKRLLDNPYCLFYSRSLPSLYLLTVEYWVAVHIRTLNTTGFVALFCHFSLLAFKNGEAALHSLLLHTTNTSNLSIHNFISWLQCDLWSTISHHQWPAKARHLFLHSLPAQRPLC